MDILVIGNGFDLAHGLKTDYGSFLKFLKLIAEYSKMSDLQEEDNTLRNQENKFCYDYVSHLFRGGNSDKMRELLVRVATQNKWIRHFQSVYTEREQKGNTGWIDFESEISSFVQALDHIKRLVSEQTIFRDEKIAVDERLSNYVNLVIGDVSIRSDADPSRGKRCGFFSLNQIDKIENDLVSDLNDLTRCLEIYLADFIEKQDLPTRLPDIKELHPQRVLSFNYTNICEGHYFPVKKGIQYDYIHGKADINHTVETCNMVLGIDEYLKKEEKQRTDFIRFKKYYQRIYKQTGCKYRDWIDTIENASKTFFKLPPQNNLYIFGHSLDVTDGDILHSLIMAPNMVTTIYYYSQKAFSQQIVNLVKIIGQNNLTAMVHGTHPCIKFRPQQDAEKT